MKFVCFIVVSCSIVQCKISVLCIDHILFSSHYYLNYTGFILFQCT